MRFSEDSEFVCIHGWDETLYREALGWVDEKRRVAFVSEKQRESEDTRVKIYVLESPLQMEKLIKQIAWSAVQRKMTVIGEGAFKEKLERCHLAADLILSEAAYYWVGAMGNARKNNQTYRRGMDLKGVFADVPAVIVGAGPSLEKNGHLLREFEKKALLFAGGNALNTIDVAPHFAAAIDGEAPYRQFKMHPFSETPFCYQSRMNGENFSLIHGERILFPDSSSDAINWLYEEEAFDGGWTVGNFLTAIAVHMGCSPIIFVGMDLCYLHQKKYAQMDAHLPDGLVRVGDVLTQRDWLMAAKWTEELAKGHVFLNATEGGILSLPSVKLETALAACTTEWDLRKWVHEAIQNLPLKKGTKRWKEWDASLRRLQKGKEHFEAEIVYQKLLFPLWQIWQPIFEREVRQELKLHQVLFFQRVLEEHGSFVLSERSSLLRHSSR